MMKMLIMLTMLAMTMTMRMAMVMMMMVMIVMIVNYDMFWVAACRRSLIRFFCRLRKSRPTAQAARPLKMTLPSAAS